MDLAVPGVIGVMLMGVGIGVSDPVAETAPQAAAAGAPVVAAPEPAPAPGPAIDCAVLKCVALTFDDGPSPEHTEALLATLESAGVPATFFVQGVNVRAYPEIAKKIVETPGMEIANHSATHPDLTGVDDQRLHEEIVGNADAIEQATGVRPTLLRPPYGLEDADVERVARESGQGIVLWDIDTEDWRDPGPEGVAAAIHDQVRPGSIVLMHDVHASSPEAMPRVITELKQQGYTLVTVSELIGTVEPGTVYTDRADPA